MVRARGKFLDIAIRYLRQLHVPEERYPNKRLAHSPGSHVHGDLWKTMSRAENSGAAFQGMSEKKKNPVHGLLRIPYIVKSAQLRVQGHCEKLAAWSAKLRKVRILFAAFFVAVQP